MLIGRFIARRFAEVGGLVIATTIYDNVIIRPNNYTPKLLANLNDFFSATYDYLFFIVILSAALFLYGSGRFPKAKE